MKRKPWSPRRDAIEGIIFVMALPFVAITIVGLATALVTAQVVGVYLVIEWVWQMASGVRHG